MRVAGRRVVMGAGAAAVLGGVLAWRTANAARYAEAARRTWRLPAPAAGIAGVLQAASLAANSHNTQPWRFHATAAEILLRPDPARRCPAVDPDDHHLFVSLGCAAENMLQAAPSYGLAGDIEVWPRHVRIGLRDSAPRAMPLAAAIPERQSTRVPLLRGFVSPEMFRALAAAAREPGVGLLLLTDPTMRARVRDAVAAAARTQSADPAFVAELRRWLRFSYTRAVATADGLFTACTGNPVLPEMVGRSLFPLVYSAEAEAERAVGLAHDCAGIAVFAAETADAAHWVAVGRAFQRFALCATVLGLKLSLLNQPVEVAALRGPFAAALGLGARRPDLVVRFGVGPTVPRSLRRPVAAVLDSA